MTRTNADFLARQAIFIAIATALALPMILQGPLTHGSFRIDFVWATQFDAAIDGGDLYPRWLPGSFNGLGAPVFYFYAPFSFFVVAAFSLLGFATWTSIVLAMVTFHAASGAVMWQWLRRWGDRPALIGAIIYMALPYHLIDFYRRGALAEFATFAIVPLVAIGVARAVELKRPAMLALAYAALIMTHLPVALLTGVFLVPSVSFWSGHGRGWIPTGIGMGLGIGLASIYLIPALSLQEYINAAALWGRHFSPPFWILTNAWNWPERRETLLIAAAILSSGGAAILIWRRKRVFWPAFVVILCCMAGNLVPGLWSIPMLAKVQFPWRMMTLADFALATALTIAFTEGISRRLLALAITPAAILSAAVLALPLPIGPPVAQLERQLPDVEEYRIGTDIIAAAELPVTVGIWISLTALLFLTAIMVRRPLMSRSIREQSAHP